MATVNVGSASAPGGAPSSIKRPTDAYTITLTARGKLNLEVSSPMPERFTLAMSAQWDSPFARSSANAVAGALKAATGGRVNIDGSGLINTASALGAPSRTKVESMQVWQESSPFTISLPLVLYAIDSPQSEITEKVKKLLQLCAPFESGQLLTPPGPSATTSNSSGGGTNVTVRIGNILTMEKCVVKSVNGDIDALLHSSGHPMRAEVNVEVESFFSSFSVQDIDAIFKG